MKVVIAAGGTGGHLLPAQQLAQALAPDASVFFVGHLLDRSPFFERGAFGFCAVASAAPSKGWVRFLREAGRGFWQSVRALWREKPDVVVGFGSFHTFPVLLAALVLRKRIVLFEANCLLGKVNRLFAPFAEWVAAQFVLERAPKRVAEVPLLPWKKGGREWEKREARRALGLDEAAPTVLVFGGSQGAAFLNRAVPAALPEGVQAIHLTGREGEARYRGRAVVKGFETEMARAYAAADIAVCRAGAGTVAELIRYGLPAVLVPYPHATDDHQRINGEFLAKKVGGARMVLETEADRLPEEIRAVFEAAPQMRQALERFRASCAGRVDLSEMILRGL